MRSLHSGDVTISEVVLEGAEGVRMGVLLAEEQGAPNFRMRLFEVGPGGKTPYHQHNWEHEVFVLEGEGFSVDAEKKKHAIGPGSVVFVPPNEFHNFTNPGEKPLRFLCLVPTDEVCEWREQGS